MGTIIVGAVVIRDHEATKFSTTDGFSSLHLWKWNNIRSTSNNSACGEKENAPF